MKCKWIALSLLLVGAQAMAQTDTSDERATDSTTAEVTIIYNDERDPLEGFNRAMWDFNYQFLDKYFYRDRKSVV